MKISLEWLKTYVDYEGTAAELAELITQFGFTVDAVEATGADWMLEVDVTSNRPDCLGHIGLAREVAAITGARFHLPETPLNEQGIPAEKRVSVRIDAPDLCGRYTARVIEDVKIGPSPEWMARRLQTVGIRSINNVVDVTNYVMMEIGQPLHSFDYDKLQDGKIIVRRANPGEKMEMIDHRTIELNGEILVIADSEKPAALAGVMGGLFSEVTDATKTILLESAHFEPLCIRKTARLMTLGSESSFRFERNVDIVMLEWASRRAAALLQETADGKVLPGVVDVWPALWRPATITMRLSRLEKLLGVAVPTEAVMRIFASLALAPKQEGDRVICMQPSWRRDVTREVDLIEEVIRVYGYKHVPTTGAITINVTTSDAFQLTRRAVTTALIGCGYFETVNVAFMDDGQVPLFCVHGWEPLRVRPDTRKSNNALRHTLLPSLLTVRQRNQAVGNGRCDCFELAAVHEPAGPGELPRERQMLCLMTDGEFRELRGTIEAAVGTLNKDAVITCEPADLYWTEKGEGAVVKVNGAVLGYAGRISRSLQKAYGLEEQQVCMAELAFGDLVHLQGSVVSLKPLARFPGIKRDLSLVLAEGVSWQQIQTVIERQQISDLCELDFVGIYRGKGIEPGQKSLTLTLQFRRAETTLTHEEVDVSEKKIIAALHQELGAVLRT